MNAIRLVAETSDTVTISRTDLDAPLRAEEDASDLVAVKTHRVHEARVGRDAKAGYYTDEEAMTLLEGISPIKVWRQKRYVTQRTLAVAAGVSASYLAEVKPGSVDAIRRLAGVLDVSMECLTAPLKKSAR